MDNQPYFVKYFCHEVTYLSFFLHSVSTFSTVMNIKVVIKYNSKIKEFLLFVSFHVVLLLSLLEKNDQEHLRKEGFAGTCF